MPAKPTRHGGRPPPRPTLAARVAALRELKGWRLWVANLATAVLVPALLFGALEGGLHLFRCGYPVSFLLRGKTPGVLVENDQYLWQFYSRRTNLRPNPLAVTPAKPAGTARILILGESAAAGTPDPAFSFSRILDRMLRQALPARRFEVLNAAMRGVNSHILRSVARECCARLRPDVVVVYLGNNETVGLYAPGPRGPNLAGHRHWLRLLEWVRATRTGQLLQPVLGGLAREDVPADRQDNQFFQARRLAADDPRRTAVYDNFGANLEDICEAAHGVGARVLLMTLPVNLQDFAPLGSLHRPGLTDPDLARWQTLVDAGGQAETAGDTAAALTNFTAAAALDDHFAQLHFRLGRCWWRAGQFEAAGRAFALACDWDALQFRADTRLNGIIRGTATRLESRGVRLVDAQSALAKADAGEHGIPGRRLFRDHVHPSFEGDYLLARTLFPELCAMVASPTEPGPVPDREECARQLGFTQVEEARLSGELLRMTSLPPFTSQLDHAVTQRLAEQDYGRRFGNLTTRDFAAAWDAYAGARQRFPDDWRLPYAEGRLRLLARDPAGALAAFEAAQKLLPHWAPIRIGMTSALCGLARPREALDLLEALRAEYPYSEEIQLSLAAVARQAAAR